MSDAIKNFAYSLVATAPSPASSGTSLIVTAAQGTYFPTVPFNATIWPTASQPTNTNAEIVRVTAIGTDTLTIVRQQEGTSARTVVIGDQIAATITAKSINDRAGKRVIAEDSIVDSGYGTTVVGDLEISSGIVLELASNSVMEIT